MEADQRSCVAGNCGHRVVIPEHAHLVLMDLAWMQKYFSRLFDADDRRYETLEETCDALLNGYIGDEEPDASRFGDLYREHYNNIIREINLEEERPWP